MSAFFSSAEVGFIYLSENILITTSNEKRRMKFQKLLQCKNSILSTTLLLNNLSNAAFASASVIAVSEALKSANVNTAYVITISSIASSVVLFVFGELIPKFFALKQEKFVLLISGNIMLFLSRVFFPVSFSANWIIKILGKIFQDKTKHQDAKEELRNVLLLRHQQGKVKTQDRNMINGILELQDADVRDIITPKSEVCFVDISNIEELKNTIAKAPYTRFPVINTAKKDSDEVVGVIHSKDLLALTLQKPEVTQQDIAAIISEPVLIPETRNLQKQLSYFQSNKQHLALAVNEFGDIVGIVTLEDILEEIVGDIDDEHDHAENDLIESSSGAILVAGDYRVRDFNKEIGTNFDDEEFTTMAGLVIGKAEKIPMKNESFVIDGYNFNVKQRTKSKITQIEINKSDQV